MAQIETPLDSQLDIEVLPVTPAPGVPASLVQPIIECMRLEFQTFRDAGYVQSDNELVQEYAPYEGSSSFLAARSTEGQIVGVVRVIDHSDKGFKTLRDISAGRLTGSVPADLKYELTIEVGTLSIHAEHRHSNTGMLLYGALIRKSLGEGKSHVVASFDDGREKSFLRDFEALFPFGVTRIGEPTEYMGTPTTPVLIHVPTIVESIELMPPVAQLLKNVSLVDRSAALAPTKSLRSL